MEAFATTDDLQKRWRPLNDAEKTRAETLLLDATAKITSMCNDSGVTINDEDEVQSHNLLSITCEAVKRAMLFSVDSSPVTNYSQGAGDYTESFTYANPTGNLYLTNDEKKLLGIKRQRIFSIQPTGGVLND